LTLEECFALRKLRRIRPDPLKAQKSLEAAAAKLERAKALLVAPKAKNLEAGA